MFFGSWLRLLKTIILSLLSGNLYVSVSLGSVPRNALCSFGGVMFPFFHVPCGLVLRSVHLRESHLVQTLHWLLWGRTFIYRWASGLQQSEVCRFCSGERVPSIDPPMELHPLRTVSTKAAGVHHGSKGCGVLSGDPPVPLVLIWGSRGQGDLSWGWIQQVGACMAAAVPEPEAWGGQSSHRAGLQGVPCFGGWGHSSPRVAGRGGSSYSAVVQWHLHSSPGLGWWWLRGRSIDSRKFCQLVRHGEGWGGGRSSATKAAGICKGDEGCQGLLLSSLHGGRSCQGERHARPGEGAKLAKCLLVVYTAILRFRAHLSS